MKTILLLIMCLAVLTSGFSQIDTVNTGTSANSGNGDNLRAAFGKVNANDKYLDGRINSPHFTDTAWFDYLNGALSGTRFLTITPTGGGDSGVLRPASAQLINKLKSFPYYFFDRKNGELVYQYTKNDSLITNYGTAKDNKTGQSLGLETIEMLTGAYEKSMRFIWRQWLENKFQWLIILLLYILALFNTVRLNDIEAKLKK